VRPKRLASCARLAMGQMAGLPGRVGLPTDDLPTGGVGDALCKGVGTREATWWLNGILATRFTEVWKMNC
jgi:hypothetical protein